MPSNLRPLKKICVAQAGLILWWMNRCFVGSLPSERLPGAWSGYRSLLSSSSSREIFESLMPEHGSGWRLRSPQKLALRRRLLHGKRVLALRGGEDDILDGVCRISIPGEVESLETALDYFEDKQVQLDIISIAELDTIALKYFHVFT
jgi:hypothetical protein